MELTSIDKSRVHEVLLYWQKQWDWESRILFGISEADLNEVILTWPNELEQRTERMARAVFKGFGEILYGASSLPEAQFRNVLGESRNEFEVLFSRIKGELRYLAAE
ncbi:hypothetical protein [Thaumasiovibrio subtropicus]|uniref:hypothetical protein n=1 Tax=Thaumasiovibrio subtropicus TaxID=1891207 RepID=UPI000B35D900|nr:hypothetical protein [Thaumasiovibrio subtropicus]